jgi:hypothetical protein
MHFGAFFYGTVDMPDAGVDAGLRIVLDGLLGPYRQVAQQHLGARLAQSLGDVSGFKVGRAKGVLADDRGLHQLQQKLQRLRLARKGDRRK